MRSCRTTQLDVKHEEAEGGEQTMSAPWNLDANMPLYMAALVISHKSYFIDKFEDGLDYNVWNFPLCIFIALSIVISPN